MQIPNMQIPNMQIPKVPQISHKRGLGATLVFACASAAVLAAGAQNPKPPARYGAYSITNAAQTQIVQTKGTNTMTIKVDGPNLSAKSPRYDLKAPHITMLLVKGGTPSRFRAQTATGTGGVLVTFRSPDEDETTTITCDKANYGATDTVKNLGKLRLTGNVHSVRRSPNYGPEPLVGDFDSAVVEFAPGDKTIFTGENASASGSIKEPPPRPKTGGKP